MNKQDRFDKIESYLTNSMTKEEKAIFQEELDSNPELARDVEIQKLEHESMEVLIANDLRASMSQWSSNPPKGVDEVIPTDLLTKLEKPYYKKWLLMGVLIMVTVVVGYLTWTNKVEKEVPKNETPATKDSLEVNRDTIGYADENKNIVPGNGEVLEKNTNNSESKSQGLGLIPSSEEIAYVEIVQEYYDLPEDMFSSLKSDNDNKTGPYEEALKYLKNSQYQKALSSMESIKYIDESNIQFLRGHILFKLKKYKEAENEFSKITKDEMLPNYTEARWYEFLCVASQLPKSKSKYDVFSENISGDQDFDYYSQALEIFKRIETVKK